MEGAFRWQVAKWAAYGREDEALKLPQRRMTTIEPVEIRMGMCYFNLNDIQFYGAGAQKAYNIEQLFLCFEEYDHKDKMSIAKMTYYVSLAGTDITGQVEIGKYIQATQKTITFLSNRELSIYIAHFLLPLNLYEYSPSCTIRLVLHSKNNLGRLKPLLKAIWAPSIEGKKDHFISQFQHSEHKLSASAIASASTVIDIHGKHPVHTLLLYLPIHFQLKRILLTLTVGDVHAASREWILPRPTSYGVTKRNQAYYHELINHIDRIPDVANIIIHYLEPFFTDADFGTRAYLLDLLSDDDEALRKDETLAFLSIDPGKCINLTNCTSIKLQLDLHPSNKNAFKGVFSLSIINLNLFRSQDKRYGLGWI
jgi:hypothetical protein